MMICLNICYIRNVLLFPYVMYFDHIFFVSVSQGVPVRIEVGPRDMNKKEFVAVRRDTGAKVTLREAEAVDSIKQLLEQIHHDMFAK